MRGEAVIFADIDLREAENKLRPDGTDIFLSRRPELYTPLGSPPQESYYKSGAPDVLAGVVQVSCKGQEALAFAIKKVAEAVVAGAKLIVLPELFHITTFDYAEEFSSEMIRVLQAVAGNCYIAASIVEDGTHTGILFNQHGVVLKQPQLHPCGRHPWSRLGSVLNVFDCEWGRIALIVGNDAIYPETFRLAALQGVEVVAVPTQVLEEWEITLGFRERAAENRMNILVASSTASAIYAITEDFTLWTEWRNRPFDGNINAPIVTMTQNDGLKLAIISPAAAANKMISYRTHLLNSRPWRLAQPIIS
jgi:predicted amidohydrolase